MKKLLSLLLIVVTITLTVGCSDDDIMKEECALLDRGSLLIRNSTNIDITVDVTWEDNETNAPIIIHHVDGAVCTTIFQDLPQGTVKMWWTYDDNEQPWLFEFVNIESCEQAYIEIPEY